MPRSNSSHLVVQSKSESANNAEISSPGTARYPMPSPGTTPRRRLICLTGFMGCGKTTVGQLLARHLAWRFVDLDARIEHRAGLRITEIFDRLGESAFREIEHEQLIEALGQSAELDQPTVLALGGLTQRSEEHTSELQSRLHLVCRLLLEKKKKRKQLPEVHSNLVNPSTQYTILFAMHINAA